MAVNNQTLAEQLQQVSANAAPTSDSSNVSLQAQLDAIGTDRQFPAPERAGGYASGNTFTKSLRRGFVDSQAMFGAFGRGFGKFLNKHADTLNLPEGIGDDLIAEGDEQISAMWMEAVKNPAQVTMDNLRLGNAGTFVVEALGEQFTNVLLAAIPGAAGAMAAKGVTGYLLKRQIMTSFMKQLRRKSQSKLLLKTLGASPTYGIGTRGAALGTGLSFTPLNTGEVLLHLEQEGFDPSFMTGLSFGVANTFLDLLGIGTGVAAVTGGLRKKAMSEIGKTTLKDIAKATGYDSFAAFAGEATTEALQEAIVIASQKAVDPTFNVTRALSEAENLKQIMFAGLTGGVVGGVFGAGGATISNIAKAKAANIKASHARTKIRAATAYGVEMFGGGAASVRPKTPGETPPREEGEAESLFDAKIFAEQTKKAVATVVSRVRESIASVAKGSTDPRQAGARQEIDEVVEFLEDELGNMKMTRRELETGNQALQDAINAVRRILKEIPTVAEKDQQGNATSERIQKEIRQLLAEAAELAKKKDVQGQAAKAVQLLNRMFNAVVKGQIDPASVPKNLLDKTLTRVRSLINKGVERRRQDIDAAVTTLVQEQMKAEAVQTEAHDMLPEPAMSTEQAEQLSEPEVDSSAAIDQVISGKKRATHIRGVTKPDELSKKLLKKIRRAGLILKPDFAGNRLLVVRKEDALTSLEELERADFPRSVEEVPEETAGVVAAVNEAGETIQEIVVDTQDAEAVAEATTRAQEIAGETGTVESRSVGAAAARQAREVERDKQKAKERSVFTLVELRADIFSQALDAISKFLKVNPKYSGKTIPPETPVFVDKEGSLYTWGESDVGFNFQELVSDVTFYTSTFLDMAQFKADPIRFTEQRGELKAAQMQARIDEVENLYEAEVDADFLINTVSTVTEQGEEIWIIANNGEPILADILPSGTIVPIGNATSARFFRSKEEAEKKLGIVDPKNPQERKPPPILIKKLGLEAAKTLQVFEALIPVVFDGKAGARDAKKALIPVKEAGGWVIKHEAVEPNGDKVLRYTTINNIPNQTPNYYKSKKEAKAAIKALKVERHEAAQDKWRLVKPNGQPVDTLGWTVARVFNEKQDVWINRQVAKALARGARTAGKARFDQKGKERPPTRQELEANPFILPVHAGYKTEEAALAALIKLRKKKAVSKKDRIEPVQFSKGVWFLARLHPGKQRFDTKEAARDYILRARTEGVQKAKEENRFGDAKRLAEAKYVIKETTKGEFALLQVGEIISRGKSAWVHLGEVTQIGFLANDGHNTGFDRIKNAAQNFNTGIAALLERGLYVEFDPLNNEQHANKIIFGRLPFKSAGFIEKSMANLYRIARIHGTTKAAEELAYFIGRTTHFKTKKEAEAALKKLKKSPGFRKKWGKKADKMRVVSVEISEVTEGWAIGLKKGEPLFGITGEPFINWPAIINAMVGFAVDPTRGARRVGPTQQNVEFMAAENLKSQLMDDLNEGETRASGPYNSREEALAERNRLQGRTTQERQRPTLNVYYSTGENAELSNLALRPFEYKGREYYSVEHAYQTLKSGKFDEATYNNPRWEEGGVKITGKRKADTETNVGLMEELIFESFRQNPEAAKALIATGDAKFTHAQDKGIWKTAFPKILEATRSALKAPTQERPRIERPRWVNRSDLQQNPDKIYVFGDNDQRTGLGGQARAMRDEKNAIGVRTKKAPNNRKESFYIDAEFEDNKKKIDEDFNEVLKAVRAGKTVVIPSDGLGTGRAQLGPKTLNYINQWIERITVEAGKAPTQERQRPTPTQLTGGYFYIKRMRVFAAENILDEQAAEERETLGSGLKEQLSVESSFAESQRMREQGLTLRERIAGAEALQTAFEVERVRAEQVEKDSAWYVVHRPSDAAAQRNVPGRSISVDDVQQLFWMDGLWHPSKILNLGLDTITDSTEFEDSLEQEVSMMDERQKGRDIDEFTTDPTVPYPTPSSRAEVVRNKPIYNTLTNENGTPWTLAEQAVSFVMDLLNIKQRIVLFDNDSASMLIDQYKADKAAQKNKTERARINKKIKAIKDVLEDNDNGETIFRFEDEVFVFISKEQGASDVLFGETPTRMLTLMHEMGHLVEVTHFRQLPKKLQKEITKHMNADTTADRQEQFANWMAKLFADQYFVENGQFNLKTQNKAKDPLAKSFMDLAYKLRKVFNWFLKKLKSLPNGKYKKEHWEVFRRAYPRGFRDWAEGLLLHARSQRVTRTSKPKFQTKMGEQIYDELGKIDNGGAYIPGGAPNMKMPATRQPQQQTVFGPFWQDLRKIGKRFNESPMAAVKMILQTADGELRGMGSWVTENIANAFHAPPGTEVSSQTVFRNIRNNGASWRNELDTLLHSIPGANVPIKEQLQELWSGGLAARKARKSAEQVKHDAVLEHLLLHTDENNITDPAVRSAVQRVRAYLNRYADEMESKGINFVREPNYFPLMLDALSVEKNGAEFIDILINDANFTRDDAHDFRFNVLRDSNGGLNNPVNAHVNTAFFEAPGASFLHPRTLPEQARRRLIERGFYNKDLAVTMLTYVNLGNVRMEWQSRWGWKEAIDQRISVANSRGANLKREDPVVELKLKLWEARYIDNHISDVEYKRITEDILPAYSGQIGLRVHPSVRKISTWMVIYQNLRVLPLSIFSQFVDPGTIAWRADFGGISEALSKMLDSRSREELWEMAETLGVLRTDLTEHILNDQALSTYYSGKAKKINDWFFRLNMMEGWTNIMRVYGLSMGREFIKRNARIADDPSKSTRKRNLAERKLKELGLSVDQAKSWDGSIRATGAFDDLAIRSALHRFIDEGFIRPEAPIRPVYMSDVGYSIGSHLKQFLYGFHKTFLERAYNEAKVHQNFGPAISLAIVTMALAAVGYELRRKLTGADDRYKPEGINYVLELFERSGMPGAFQLAFDMEQADDYGKPFALGVAGPTLEQLYEFTQRDLKYMLPRSIPVVASIPAARRWMRYEVLE